MAKLTDLPDEILITIFDNFKLSGQRSPYIRRRNERHAYEYDAVKRTDLASLAQVCKLIYRLAQPLLYANRYLYLYMRSSRPYQTELNLALLGSWRSLHYLICDIYGYRSNSFFTCLSNAITAETLRGLSVKLHGDEEGGGSIDLGRLSQFPHLLGLELRLDDYMQGYEVLVPPPSSLPSLKELHVVGMYTVAQTMNVLSLASASTLEVLGLCRSPLDFSGRSCLWASVGGDRFTAIHTLNIALGYGKDLPAALLAGIPTYLPSLRVFNLECMPRETDYHEILATGLITSLTIKPGKVMALRNLLLSVTAHLKPNPKLRTIHTDLNRFSVNDEAWSAASTSDIMQLSHDARGAALSHSIELEPAYLTDQMEQMRLRQRKEREERERQEQNTSGW